MGGWVSCFFFVLSALLGVVGVFCGFFLFYFSMCVCVCHKNICEANITVC